MKISLLSTWRKRASMEEKERDTAGRKGRRVEAAQTATAWVLVSLSRCELECDVGRDGV